MYIRMIFLSVFSLFNVIIVVGGSGVLTYKTYTMLQDSNIRYVGNIISTFTSKSKVDCSTTCNIDGTCIGFGYNRGLGQCEQYNSIISDGTVSLSSDGWTMYSSQGWSNIGFGYNRGLGQCEQYNSIVSDGTVSLSSDGWIMYSSQVIPPATLCTESLLLDYPYPVRFNTTKEQMDVANKSCIDDGLKLVKIDTSQKMEFIRSIIQNCSNYQTVGYWVDGSNADAVDWYAVGAWTFQDGAPMNMSSDFWCSDKPDNPHIEHCVRLNKGGCDHYMNDKECTDSFGVICEP